MAKNDEKMNETQSFVNLDNFFLFAYPNGKKFMANVDDFKYECGVNVSTMCGYEFDAIVLL